MWVSNFTEGAAVGTVCNLRPEVEIEEQIEQLQEREKISISAFNSTRIGFLLTFVVMAAMLARAIWWGLVIVGPLIYIWLVLRYIRQGLHAEQNSLQYLFWCRKRVVRLRAQGHPIGEDFCFPEVPPFTGWKEVLAGREGFVQSPTRKFGDNKKQ
jgi:hypothetical protein